MQVAVGTFNLNDLFSRWNCRGAIQQGGPGADVSVVYTFTGPDTYRIRTFRGRLVKAKMPVDRALLEGNDPWLIDIGSEGGQQS